MPRLFSSIVGNIQRGTPIPNKCPICHHTVIINNPNNIVAIEPREVQAVFQCPNDECRAFFIAYYIAKDSTIMELISLKPSKIEIENFPPAISEISPTFISVYREASEVKQLGFLQIAGPGYRKAFEFLIKDYAKHHSTSNDVKAEIETLFSGRVVEKYITDKRIQAVAKRALWLGNDESHYLRKWEQQNIDDLITLIKLTIDWIEIEQSSEDYLKEMPDK